nr:hypothetical protein GCM10025732_07220 [Glycomyces mayteni]
MRRGPPAPARHAPNVVECHPVVFVELATGRLAFADAVASGRVAASGQRADLTDVLPLTGPHGEDLEAGA